MLYLPVTINNGNMVYPQQTFKTQDVVAFLTHRYSHAPGRFIRYMLIHGGTLGDTTPSSLVEEWFKYYFGQRAEDELRALRNRLYELAVG